MLKDLIFTKEAQHLSNTEEGSGNNRAKQGGNMGKARERQEENEHAAKKVPYHVVTSSGSTTLCHAVK